MPRIAAIVTWIYGVCFAFIAHAGDDLANELRQLDTRAISTEQAELIHPQEMLERNIAARLRQANRQSTQEWRLLKNQDDWERFRDVRIEKLRRSLGTYPDPPPDLHVRVVRTEMGNGYRVENILFESRPGLFVTANLYLPEKPGDHMPGLILCHSHHAPKSEGELQDLGQQWARRGCLVLVPELLGHGERRQHPFFAASDFSIPYRLGRQDYYFRFVLGMQLHALGDSLAGWFVWDLMRSVDLLLSRPGIDPKRIVLLGAVAGGGDPAAVAAAIDTRIAAVVPFNFGGPQPETRYPLADDAEEQFQYAGSGSWESTRSLTASARDGFLPWVIVGSIAPRGLIYAHEFQWDRPRDPVWKRLETIYGWYDSRDQLDAVSGAGSVRGKSDTDTHCNNIGPVHRRGIDPVMNRWFQIAPPLEAPRERRSADELNCWTPELKAEVKPEPFHRLARQLGPMRIQDAQNALNQLTAEQRRDQLMATWTRLLGDVAPASNPRVLPNGVPSISLSSGVTAQHVTLEVEPDLVVPLLLLLPASGENSPSPIVLACAQAGKRKLLEQRAEQYAKLLSAGIGVCLADVRGTGETAPRGDTRGRGGPSTDLSSTELMLGRTMLGARFHDLRTVLGWLRRHPDVNSGQIAFWGDSCTRPNPSEQNVAIPLDLEQPPSAEPLGGLLALLAGLYEPDLRAISAHGGLSGYLTLLESPFCCVPHDALVPGAITAGDLGSLVAARAPRPLRVAATVDALNRAASPETVSAVFAPAVEAFRVSDAAAQFQIVSDAGNSADWLQRQLSR